MQFYTIDFETFYRSKKDKLHDKYSLKTLTYEEYINHEEFYVFGMSVKQGASPSVWYPHNEIPDKLNEILPPNNCATVLAHNAYFECAILEWVYGVKPAAYRCTMSMANGLWPHFSNSLSAVAKRLLPKDQQKGTELEKVDGIRDLTPELEEELVQYCINDTDITFEIYKIMYGYYPRKEEEIIDMTFQMWGRRPFIANHEVLENYLKELQQEKTKILKTLDERDGGKLSAFIENHKTKKSKSRDSVEETVIAGRELFPKYVKEAYGIDIPRKHSPTPKNPENITWALGKKDLEFLELQKDHQELKHLWDALLFIRGDDIQRTERLLKHSAFSAYNPEGRLAVPLKVNGAHTKRFSGMNKVNFQNFKRKSPHRTALEAPPGHMLTIGDSSNIESRLTFWFCGQDDKVELYRNGEDLYNEFASKLFGRLIDRKKKEIRPDGSEYYPDEIEGFVGKVAVLGLGYQMGDNKFWKTLAQGAMGGPQLFYERSFVSGIVQLFRYDNKYVKEMWTKLEKVIYDMADPEMVPYQFRCLTIEHQRILLPSGLYLTYPQLHKSEEDGFVYWNGKYWKSLYGGILLENIIQALARIVLTDMMLAYNAWLRPLGGLIALTVHDEIVAVIRKELAEQAKAKMIEVMTTAQGWYADLPLATEVDLDRNYSK